MSPKAERRWHRPNREQEGETPSRDGIPLHIAGREWWQAARLRAQTSMARSPSALIRYARRWSPGVVPPMLGSLLLLAALALAARSAPGQQPLVAPQTLLKLLVVYMLAGTLYGFLLYFAANDLVWMCLLVVGLPVYLVLTLGVLWGPGGVGLAGVACMALMVWYIRRFTYTVPAGQLVVTTLGGGYARTLWRGRTLLGPGERIEATLDAGEHRFACPTRRADIPNELGEIYQARASATVGYRLIPAEVHHAVLASDDWERDLHEQIGESLMQALGEWGAHLLMGDGTPPDQLLAKTLLRELREQVRPRGIHIAWVSVRDIWLAPEGELLPAEEHSESSKPPAAHELSRYFSGSPASSVAPGRNGDRSADGPSEQESSEGDEAKPPNLFSADVLSDAYEAVREGRITDPETIRQIADAFLKVAADEGLNATFPYDAVAAAYILLDRAESLAQGRR